MKKTTVAAGSGVRLWERTDYGNFEKGKLREKREWVFEIERERDNSEAVKVPM